MLEFRVLGPLQVGRDERLLPLGGFKQRGVLALLLLDRNRVVSRDRLVDGLWRERPPASAANSIQIYVSKLRRLLGDADAADGGAIVTEPPGYRLRVAPGELDADQFERLITAGSEALGAGNADRAERAFAHALTLWHGPPFADFADEPFAQAEIARLEQLRLRALEEQIEAQTALGRHAAVLAQLPTLVDQHPLEERLRAQLMVALYRSGRQADALAAYQNFRRLLADELGLDPSPDLREIERQILRQDGALLAPTSSRGPTRPSAAPGDFPTQARGATSLPVAANALIGRERETSQLVSLLRGNHRLITVTGPGGTGKTRLALQVATDLADVYPDGVFWVPLAGVTDAELVLPAVRQALGAPDDLARDLRGQELLLVLDTFEHLVAAAPDLAELLGSAAEFQLLITSRSPLHLSAEFEYPVDPLSATSAATLFIERARAVGRALRADESVNEICARLDNLPLALELAAARTKLLDPVSLLSRLERRLPLLAGGPNDVPEHQRTLRATIAWSYDLLDEDAQALFRRLTVFAGGFSLEAAEEVGGSDLDALSRVADASLLKSVGDGRLLMLDTIREYGRERLDQTCEAAKTRDRHAAHFARLADRRWPELARGDDPTWNLSTVQAEVRNLHSAIEWSLERGGAKDVLAIGSGMYPFWIMFGYLHQGKRWLTQALELPSPADSRRGHALAGLADLALQEGDLETAKQANEESLALFRKLDEPLGIAANLTQLSSIALFQGDREAARRFAEESAAIRRQRLDSLHLGRVLSGLAAISVADGDHDHARELLEEAVDCWSAEAPESSSLISCYEALGEVLRLQGNHPGAIEAFATSIRLSKRRGQPPSAEVFEGIAAVWATLGQRESGARMAGAAERIREQMGGGVRVHPNRPLPERLEPAWSEGHAMSTEDAGDFVLSELSRT